MSIPDFTGVSSTAVSDVLREGGLPHRALHWRMGGIASGARLAGPAYCVRGEIALGAAETPGSQLMRFEVFRRFIPGSVLLIGTGGYEEAAVFGEIMALAIKARGGVGAVVDGGIRDRDALAQSGLPVFARFSTPVSSAGRWRLVELDEPLVMPGQTTSQVQVNPGDWLVGDGDGIVAVPGEHALDVASDARRLAATRLARHAELSAGADPEALLRAMNRFGHIRRHATRAFA